MKLVYKYRVINWNLSCSGKIETKLNYLESFIRDLNTNWIICLEELTEHSARTARNRDSFKQLYYSLDLRKPGNFDGENRKLGCAIAISKGLNVKSFALIDRAPFPERTLEAEIIDVRNNLAINALVFHSLTGVGYKKAKSAQFSALLERLSIVKDEMFILCGDFNEPKVDAVNPKDNEYFNQAGDKGIYAKQLFEPKGTHSLNDAYRLYTKNNKPSILASPLAVSHKVAGGAERRYDYIFLSKFQVSNIEYRYNESIEAGSDHALVVADIAI